MKLDNVTVAIEDTTVVADVSLSVFPGEIHALMGKNGSGKSSLAYALAGHPQYKIVRGAITLDGEHIQHLSPEERARKGLFLAFQQPPTIPGVSVMTFLKEIHYAVTGIASSVEDFYSRMTQYMRTLSIAPDFAHRGLNEGFSGGERKKFEMLQLLLLRPKIAILDEIDSGLDVDALRVVSAGVAEAKRDNPTMKLLLITHYQRLLDYIVPDKVHVLHAGSLVASGDASLARHIEQQGYQQYE